MDRKEEHEQEPGERAERSSGFSMHWSNLPRVGAFFGTMLAAGGAGGFVGSALHDDVAENRGRIVQIEARQQEHDVDAARENATLTASVLHLSATVRELKEELREMRIRLEYVGALPPRALGAGTEEP